VGYTGFFNANESDHQGAFIKISKTLLDNRIELPRPKKRDIGSKSKSTDIYGYKQYVYKRMKEHSIDKKLDVIEREKI
jgi:hypothetical protein